MPAKKESIFQSGDNSVGKAGNYILSVLVVRYLRTVPLYMQPFGHAYFDSRGWKCHVRDSLRLY